MRDYAGVAGQAFGWVEAVGAPESDDLYEGTAGALLGCAEATSAGLDVARVAAGARDRLIHIARHGGENFVEDGLFGGWPGIAVALRAWDRAVDDPVAAQVAAELSVRVAVSPVTNECTDVISGAAGTLLGLLDDDSPSARDAAGQVADHLAAAAEPAPGGLHWRVTPDWHNLQPGFSHGTAGVGYALGMAGRVLARPDLVETATRGAQALLDVGDHRDGWAVPLTIPAQPHDPPVAYGWCHGAAGTLRLFVLLDEMDPRPQWHDTIAACLQSLRGSRIPQRLYPGYWDNVGRCCGTAGVGKVLLDRYHATGDPTLLAWADTLADDVVDRAVTTADGLSWSNTEHTATPPELPPETGFMQGAAGVAGWLAQLADAHRGGPPADLLGLAPPWI